MKNVIKEYWNDFIANNHNYSSRDYDYWHFTDNEQDALSFANDVITGKKNATSSYYNYYTHDK